MFEFNAADKSFHTLMLSSDCLRFESTMTWNLWKQYTLTMMLPMMANMKCACAALSWTVEKAYRNTVTVGRQQQVDSKVGHSVYLITAGFILSVESNQNMEAKTEKT